MIQNTSAVYYASEFQQYAEKIDWNKPAFIKNFYKEFKERVKNEITKNKRNTDLQDFINKTIRIDNRQNKRKFEKKEKYKIYFFKQDNKVNTKSTYYKLMLMKLNATRYKKKLF